MTVSYKCKCGEQFTIEAYGKPVFKTNCPKCGEFASRCYSNIALDKEPETVSGAIQTMLHAPSNKIAI